MKKGNIILIRSYDFTGHQIRRVTGGTYNHVGLFVTDNIIIESNPGKGVILTPFDVYKKQEALNKCDYAIYKFIHLGPVEIESVITFLLDKVGSKYDFLQLLSLFIFFIFNITRRIEPIDIRNAFICSELLAEAVESIGVRFVSHIDSDNITPTDIEKSIIVAKISDTLSLKKS